MARPRKARAPEELDRVATANIDHDALDKAGVDSAIHAQHLAIVDQQYSVNLPYELKLYVAAIRQRAAESAVRLIEIGCMLIQIREHETRDVYLGAISEAGLNERFARRAMQAAVKLRDRKLVQQLGVAKALELMSEDDETLDTLDAGGTLAGLSLDDIDRMSVRQLKETLRRERAEHADEKAADEEIIRKKDERINKLSRRLTQSGAREQAGELIADYNRFCLDVAANLKAAAGTVEAIQKLYDDIGEHPDEEIAQSFDAGADLVASWIEKFEEALGR